jgi:hypothetical protein
MTERKLEKLSWCETSASTGCYHLREISPAGLKLGGGADTLTLCGLKAAWDNNYPVTWDSIRARPEYGWPCKSCAEIIQRSDEKA